MKMIRRLTICIYVIIGFIMAGFLPHNNFTYETIVYAQNTTNNQKEILEEDIGIEAEEDINALYDYINNMKINSEIPKEFEPQDFLESYIKNGTGNLSVKEIGRYILNILFKEVNVVVHLTISIIIIALLCSLLKNLQDAFSNENISEVAFYACYAVIIMILSKSFVVSISVAKDVINNISNFMSALLPILVTMISASGGYTTAATLDPVILFCVIFIPKIYADVILPLILMEFVLEFVNNMSKKHKINNLCGLFKQVILWGQGIIITFFIGILTIRGIASNTIDAVTLKTAKYAVDNFIPVVGKAFSDAIASVAAYSLLIKNAVSSIGLLIIVFIILYPLIKLFLMTIVYKISSAVIEPVGDSRIIKSLEAAGKSMTLITSCVLTVSLMSFVLLGIIASCGKYIVGGL